VLTFARPTADPRAHIPFPFLSQLPETVIAPGMPSVRVTLPRFVRCTHAASRTTTVLRAVVDAPRGALTVLRPRPREPVDLVAERELRVEQGELVGARAPGGARGSAGGGGDGRRESGRQKDRAHDGTGTHRRAR